MSGVSFRAHDGSVTGTRDPIAAIVVRSPDALRLILNAPGRLGLPELTRPVSSTSTALTAALRHRARGRRRAAAR